LIALVAAGAASAIIERSCSRIGESWGGCLAKNPSTGAPRSLRGPNFIAGAAGFLAPRAAAFFLVAALAALPGADFALAFAFAFGLAGLGMGR
jgi:hypothetical protein